MTSTLTKNILRPSRYFLHYKKTKFPPAVAIHRENFCKKKNVTCYLDPKTSRWLGTDPAMGEYLPSAPVNEEAKKRNGNLPGMGGVFNYVNLHVYHYAGNNPVKLVDPTGEWVILFGITGTAGSGAGVTLETGIALSKDNKGNYQIGTYQSTGGGCYIGLGGSVTITGTIAPLAQNLSDLEGLTIATGGSLSFLSIGTAGLDVNIPLDGPKKNFSISASIGIGGSIMPIEVHAITTTTTTKKYAEGRSLDDLWQKATDAGLFEGMGADVIEHFKSFMQNQTNEIIQ